MPNHEPPTLKVAKRIIAEYRQLNTKPQGETDDAVIASSPNPSIAVAPPIAARETPTVHHQVKAPKEPSKDAFLVYRYWVAKGMTQEEMEEDPLLMEKLGRQVHQGTISRMLKQVRRWLEAGNILPGLPMQHGTKPISMDPEQIDLGARQDGHTPRQRERHKSG